MSSQNQGTTLFAAILVLIASALVLQLWLLTVSMEALLSGEYKTLGACCWRSIPDCSGTCLRLIATPKRANFPLT